MSDVINNLNKLMRNFHKNWEKENTNEMFFLLNGINDTKEINLGVEKNNKRLDKIEQIINDENNLEALLEGWELIDLKMLDSLVNLFEIDVEKFKERLNTTKGYKQTKEFFN